MYIYIYIYKSPFMQLCPGQQELSRAGDDSSSSATAGAFSFQRLPGAEAQQQPLLVHSINHRPSAGTPTFAAAAAAGAAARQAFSAAAKPSADEESAVSEVLIMCPCMPTSFCISL